MGRLGYTRYVAQGGDVGAIVTNVMALFAPKGLLGVHFNFLGTIPPSLVGPIFGLAPVPTLPEDEQVQFNKAAAVFRRGYLVLQGEHPQTVGYGLTDSPVGLAAWMLDHDADSYAKISRAFLDGQPTGGLTRDRILDNITLYWLTNSATSAARVYWENQQLLAATAGQPSLPVSLPVAYTVFPGELFQTPRTWLEELYPNLNYFNTVNKGGHFAAWEEPELFAEEMRSAFRALR
jgi:pimeloyl-ACP methyl ester carboxylesterase